LIKHHKDNEESCSYNYQVIAFHNQRLFFPPKHIFANLVWLKDIAFKPYWNLAQHKNMWIIITKCKEKSCSYNYQVITFCNQSYIFFRHKFLHILYDLKLLSLIEIWNSIKNVWIIITKCKEKSCSYNYQVITFRNQSLIFFPTHIFANFCRLKKKFYRRCFLSSEPFSVHWNSTKGNENYEFKKIHTEMNR